MIWAILRSVETKAFVSMERGKRKLGESNRETGCSESIINLIQ